MIFEKLDYKLDTEDAVFGPLAPDGKVDPPVAPATSPFSWAGLWLGIDADGNETTEDVGTALEVRPDGLLAGLRLPTDRDVVKFRVVCTASVDKADTTEIETISNVYNGGGEHSKATDLGGTGMGVLPKGAPLP